MRYLKPKIVSVICLFVFSSSLASASCGANLNGEQEITRVSGQTLTATCKSDINRKVSELTQIGLCAEFPVSQSSNSAAQGLGQCQNLLSQPVDLTLTIGSSVSVAAQAPAPGIYNYFYQLGPARGQYSALWKFSQPIIGGDGTGNVGGAQLGVWCYPAPFEYTTSTVFEGIFPNVCSNTEPTTLPLSTLFFNNVGHLDWRGITSMASPDTPPLERQYQLDADLFQNVILLDEDLNFIQQEQDKANTAYVLVIQKLSPSMQVTSGELSMTFETTLTDKARVSVSCPAIIGSPCSLNTPYTSTSINLVLN